VEAAAEEVQGILQLVEMPAVQEIHLQQHLVKETPGAGVFIVQGTTPAVAAVVEPVPLVRLCQGTPEQHLTHNEQAMEESAAQV